MVIWYGPVSLKKTVPADVKSSELPVHVWTGTVVLLSIWGSMVEEQVFSVEVSKSVPQGEGEKRDSFIKVILLTWPGR